MTISNNYQNYRNKDFDKNNKRDSLEYKNPDTDFKDHLAYEEAKKIVETMDESLTIQAEYDYNQLSADLALDCEDIILALERFNWIYPPYR